MNYVRHYFNAKQDLPHLVCHLYCFPFGLKNLLRFFCFANTLVTTSIILFYVKCNLYYIIIMGQRYYSVKFCYILIFKVDLLFNKKKHEASVPFIEWLNRRWKLSRIYILCSNAFKRHQLNDALSPYFSRF